jgi:hypothetical protein
MLSLLEIGILVAVQIVVICFLFCYYFSSIGIGMDAALAR